MSLTVFCKRFPDHDFPGGEDESGFRRYTEIFEVDQTDAGPDACGVAVAIAAQSANAGPDIVPLRGDNYHFDGLADLDSYCAKFSWKRPYPKDNRRRWHITVEFEEAAGINPGRLAATPLFWPTEYWVEWMEAQIPVETARNVDSLTQIGRAANVDGPIVNACGEQPTDPYVKTVHYPILCCQKAYATLNEIIALNNAYEDSTNVGTFFGSAPRTAKYLLTDNSRIQKTRGVSFYLGTTRIWFKRKTWDLKVLNNGFNCFIRDKTTGNLVQGNTAQKFGNPFENAPKLFRFGVQDNPLASDATVSNSTPFVPSSEPMNLNIDGTARNTSLPALNLSFRDLNELDYGSIGIGS